MTDNLITQNDDQGLALSSPFDLDSLELDHPQLCEVCQAPADHKSRWGLFCEKCWILFGFEGQP